MTIENSGEIGNTPSVETSTVTTPENQPTNQGSGNTQGLKTLHQDQINHITREAHHRGYLKGKEESLSNPQPTPSSSGMTPEEIKKMVAEESAKMIQQTQMQASADYIVNQFQQKMQNGMAKYPDFVDKMKNLDFGKMVEIVQMTSALDNTADVMYDLANNPYKIASLQQLASMQPGLAMSEIQKLSSSIKSNNAAKFPEQNPPLSQINPSPIGVNNDSLPSIEYFKSRYRG